MTLYFGENTLESYIAAKSHCKKLGSEVIIIECDEIKDYTEITQHLQGINMFSDSNIILAKRLFSNKKVLKQVISTSNIVDNDSLIVWEDGNVDKRNSLVKELKSNNKLNEFPLPKSYQYLDWIIKHAEKYFAIKLTKELAQEIFRLTGENIWFIHMELRKLKTYLEVNSKEKLNKSIIKKIIADYGKANVWDFVEAFGSNDKKKMSVLFPRIIKESGDVHYIISMINRELRLIAQIKDQENMEMSSIHPYVLKKTKEKEQSYSLELLKKKYKELLILDTKIKSGEIDAEYGLYGYLFT